jgi:hypothetical protein
MAISTYQIDSVIKAYNKQDRLKFRHDAKSALSPDKYTDMVTLSGNEGLLPDTYKKIAYNLLDVLLKDKKSVP